MLTLVKLVNQDYEWTFQAPSPRSHIFMIFAIGHFHMLDREFGFVGTHNW